MPYPFSVISPSCATTVSRQLAKSGAVGSDNGEYHEQCVALLSSTSQRSDTDEDRLTSNSCSSSCSFACSSGLSSAMVSELPGAGSPAKVLGTNKMSTSMLVSVVHFGDNVGRNGPAQARMKRAFACICLQVTIATLLQRIMVAD
jgi:hypothetical protein